MLTLPADCTSATCNLLEVSQMTGHPIVKPELAKVEAEGARGASILSAIEKAKQ